MATTKDALRLNFSFEPGTGGLVPVVDGIARVTAPNRSHHTFTGTNTFLLGVDELIVVDPGPNDAKHLGALIHAIDGRPVKAILLTHTHLDHSGLARRLRDKVGAPLWFGGKHRLYREVGPLERTLLTRSCDFDLEPDEVLSHGDNVTVDGISLGVLATPGHCGNHLAFSVAGSPYLFTGDHVMGWSSTLVSPPDGSMGDYLMSLERVIQAPFSYYLPAHGGPIPEGRKFARALLAHRQHRNEQILAGVASGANTPAKLVSRMYQEISPVLKPAAAKTVEAHLDYLVAQGDLQQRWGPLGTRYQRVA